MFSQWLAGPVVRFFAWFVDMLCVQAVMTVIALAAALMHLLSAQFASAFLALSWFVISIGYAIFFEWCWRGQTIGKKLLRLRVVDAEGLKLQSSQIVIRNLLRFVDQLPGMYFVGGVTCWLNGKCQRLGDIAANTVVVHLPQVTEPDLDQLLAGKFNSLRDFPHLTARLRQNVSPAEADIVLRAILRRDEFDPIARVELFEQLAAHFRRIVEFPPEATDGMPDEQYLRNVVDVLYRTKAEGKKPAAAPAPLPPTLTTT